VFHIRIPISILALAFIVSSSVSAWAQSADEKAIAAYRLTMPTVKKVMAVTERFAAELAKDPRVQEMQKLKAQIKALDEKEELTEAQQAELEKLREREEALEQEMDRAVGFSNNQTLADMEAAIKKEPAAMRALAQEGLTPREYALCMMTLLQASLAEGFSQGKLDLAKLPPGINPENVKFVREHKAELEAMQAALGKMKK
jgi:hypothetical protein